MRNFEDLDLQHAHVADLGQVLGRAQDLDQLFDLLCAIERDVPRERRALVNYCGLPSWGDHLAYLFRGPLPVFSWDATRVLTRNEQGWNLVSLAEAHRALEVA
jgi:hypothetical protein